MVLSGVGSLRLFIADDDMQISALFRRVAEQEGWIVETCCNGRELLEAVDGGLEPALLIIDIQMPELDGIEVISYLADLNRPMRIRFITGGSDSSALAARMIAGARDLDVGRFLMKPLRVQDLKGVLHAEAELLEGFG